jgi:hypothetical protein
MTLLFSRGRIHILTAIKRQSSFLGTLLKSDMFLFRETAPRSSVLEYLVSNPFQRRPPLDPVLS